MGARQGITPAVLVRWWVSLARCVRLDAFMLRISEPLVGFRRRRAQSTQRYAHIVPPKDCTTCTVVALFPIHNNQKKGGGGTLIVRGKCECLCCSLQDPAAPPPFPRSAAGCYSQTGRTYIRSPSLSAILHPSTAGRQPVGDRMGSRASVTPAGDRRGNERAKKRGQHVIRRITARSIAHPLRSATPLTGALKAYKIGTRPKSPSTSGILARCSSVVCNAQTRKSHLN